MIYDGTHSITFITLDSFRGNKQYQRNTWKDWHMVPTTKPVVTPPERQTNIVEIPGTNARVDLSDALFGYPVYSYRSGSFEFIVDPDWNKTSDEVREMVSSFLNEKEMIMILEDDPYYYYQGTVLVSDWPSEEHYATITIDYEVYPYKRTVNPTVIQRTVDGYDRIFVRAASEPVVPEIKLSSGERYSITVSNDPDDPRRISSPAGVYYYKFDDNASLSRISKITFTNFKYSSRDYESDEAVFDDDIVGPLLDPIYIPPTMIRFFKPEREFEYQRRKNDILHWKTWDLVDTKEYQIFPKGTVITIRYDGPYGDTEDIIADGINHSFSLKTKNIITIYSVTIDSYTVDGIALEYFSEFFKTKEYPSGSGTIYQNVVRLKNVSAGTWDEATIEGSLSAACVYDNTLHALDEGPNYIPEIVIDKNGSELVIIGNGQIDVIYENGEI